MAVLLLGWGLGWRIAAYTATYQPPWVPYIAYLPLLRFWGFGLGVFVAMDRWPPLIRRTLLQAVGACRVFGVASYSIYLWHCLVLAGFRHEDENMFGSTSMWWVMAFLSVLTGVLSWKYIELRFYSFGAAKRTMPGN